MHKKITLKINELTPDSLPMARLASYLSVLSDLCGSKEHVHFDKVEEGSACLVARVEESHYTPIANRLREASQKMGAKKTLRAVSKIDELLAEDGSSGSLSIETSPIIQFSGRVETEEVMTLLQAGAIQGLMYSVGGKDESSHIKLEGADSETLSCDCTRELATKLAPLLYSPVRLHGKGRWIRTKDGWTLKKFYAESFEELKGTDAGSALRALRGLKSKWTESENAQDEAVDLRK